MDASSTKVHIKTVARVRPCFDRRNFHSSLIIDSENSTIIVKSENKEERFQLNNVFDENATQETIYDIVAQPIVAEVLGGKNGTIFAYGQTGSGKTYTMNGSDVNGNTRGIIVRSIESIFDILNAQIQIDPHFKFSIKCSYIEVYKQKAFDLLQTDAAAVKIRDSGEEIIITGTAEFVVTCVEECLHHLQNGWKNRKTAETSMNRESSRSHAIFMLTLVTEKNNGTFVNLRTSRLNFVDLAGSERQNQTNNTGERLKESGCNNQDLSHLLNIIRVIPTAKEGAHIPYRDRFLTHLLRDSLGGNSTTALIVTVHPNLEFVGDTLSTLNFAKNCKKVKNEAKVNEAVSTNDVEDLREENGLVEEQGHVEDIVAEAELQTDQTSNGSDDDIIQQLPEEYAELLDPTRTCNLSDVIVNGGIDYERLNGKVLLVKCLRCFDDELIVWNHYVYEQMEISFEHSGFQTSAETFIANHQNISSIVNRIICSSVKRLYLMKMAIPFSVYKKLTGNKISFLDLEDVIVNDENGIKVGIDKLWKEVKNVDFLEHRFSDGEAMSEIAQKLVELAPFPNLKELNLYNVQDDFDLRTFYQFLIKNTKVSCSLYCSGRSLNQMQDIQKELPKLPSGRHFCIVEYQ